jgi:competence protein ComEC
VSILRAGAWRWWLAPAVATVSFWFALLVRQDAMAQGTLPWPLVGVATAAGSNWWLLGLGGAVAAALIRPSSLQGFRGLAVRVLSYGAPSVAALWLPNGIDFSWVFVSTGQLQQQIRHFASGLNPAATGLTLGMTDGDVSGVSLDLNQEFKQLSLAHLTAVSGTNCTIVVVAAVAIANWLGQRRTARALFGGLALLCYLQLVGNQPSVLRAAVMGATVLVTSTTGSKTRAINVLSASVALLLVLQPSLASSLGLALSVAATAGVLLLAPRIQNPLSRVLPAWLALAVSVGIAAQLCCLPLLIGLQSQFNLGGLLANLLAEPVVAPATLLGIAGAVLALLSGFATTHLGGAPGLSEAMGTAAKALFWLASLFSQFILSIAHWFAVNAPVASLPGGVGGAVATLGTLVCVILLLTARNRFAKTLALIASISLLVLIIPLFSALLPNGSFPVRNWFMVACDVGQGDATVLRAGGEVAVIDVGKTPDAIDRCLVQLGIRKIDFLELTHFDLDHVGGLAGALSGRTVTHAYLTQFPDDRPGAKSVEWLLNQHEIPITKLARGDAGILGEPGNPSSLSWLVLSPHPEGADAKTANEGSISMFWTNRRVNIFTMADLPAVGQSMLMLERSQWWRDEYGSRPTVLKVSHHGSADQDPAFLQWVHATIATISVGAGNSYGHPTAKTLNWLRRFALLTLRTDRQGAISIAIDPQQLGLRWVTSRRG